jgi:nicotinamide mononucleotide adenylyltransferase
MKILEITENNTAAFVFGRFNPPTLGHKKLFDKLKKVHNVFFVFVSHTQDKKKNPLSWAEKVKIMDAQFPEMADYVVNDQKIKTIIDVMKFLETAGHKNVIMVAGSDRVGSFQELLNKYNGKEYTFDSIKVVSAGERDPDSDSLEGVSASKAREAAMQGDFDGFATMFAGSESLKKQIYDAVRQGMGVQQEAAGVGIVTKQNTTKDVNKGTLKKMLKAFRLI